MNAKHCVTLTLLLTLICGKFAIGSMIAREPFSIHMKRTEIILIGTLTNKQYAHNEVTNGFITHFTFDVKKTIEGEPNIDEDTLIFCIPGGEGVDPETGEEIAHWSSMGAQYAHLEVGETLILFLEYNKHIAKWMPQRNGLYPVHCWTIKKKKVEERREEYFVYFYSNAIDERLKHHFLGVPLPLFVRFIEVARNSPDTADPVTRIIGDAIMAGIQRNIIPDTPEANRISATIFNRIKQVVAAFEDAQPRKENKR